MISDTPRATPKPRAIQRAALAVLIVSGVVSYIDRATLAVAKWSHVQA